MGYLLMHIWLCLLAAALLGGLLMWLVSKGWAKNLRSEIEALWGGKLREAEAGASSFQAELARVQAQIPALETQVRDLTVKLGGLETEKSQLTASLTGSATKVSGLEAKLAELTTKLTALGSEKTRLEADLGGSATRASILEAQLRDTTAKLTGLETEKTQLQANAKGSATQLTSLEAQLRDATAKLTARETEKALLEADLHGSAAKLSSLESQISDWSAKWVGIESEKTDLASQLSTLVSDNKVALAAAATAAAAGVARLSALEGEKHRLESRVDAMRAEYLSDNAAFESRLADLAKQTQHLTQERDQFNARLNAMGQEVASSKSHLADVNAHSASLEAERDRLRAELAAAHQSATQQVHLITAERDQLSARLTVMGQEMAAVQAQLANAAPMAMAAAAGSTTVFHESPSISDWEPKYHHLEGRFRSFVAAQQQEGYGDIERIEGIGPVIGQKFRQAGVAWVKTLLATGGSAPGRKTLAEQTGLDPSKILKWVNAADLLRIEGITPDWAEMLEVAGVDTVKELRNRLPENLHRKMVETRAENPRQFHSEAPELEQIRSWIDAAKSMEPAVTH